METIITIATRSMNGLKTNMIFSNIIYKLIPKNSLR